MKENRTILYIGGFELPDKNAAAHRVLSNSKIFRELGKNVVLVGIDKSITDEVKVKDTYKSIQGFDTFSVPYPKHKNEWVKYLCNSSRYKTILKYFDDIEMVVFYNFQSIAMHAIIRYCKKRGIKCVADVTEWYSARGRGLAYAVLKGADTWARMNILHKKMDGLIVISKYLERYYQGDNKCVYIPALTDLKEEKWSRTEKKKDNILKIVYAGSPQQKDKMDILVESILYIKRNCQFDIIGITKEQYLLQFPHHYELLQRLTQVCFHGRISHERALEFVKAADLSCFFRSVDRVSNAGFPTKFAEAISCGTAVLTNDTSNLSDYLTDGKNGILVSKITPEVIALEIDKIPENILVEKDLFDYHHYKEQMERFLAQL